MSEQDKFWLTWETWDDIPKEKRDHHMLGMQVNFPLFQFGPALSERLEKFETAQYLRDRKKKQKIEYENNDSLIYEDEANEIYYHWANAEIIEEKIVPGVQESFWVSNVLKNIYEQSKFFCRSPECLLLGYLSWVSRKLECISEDISSSSGLVIKAGILTSNNQNSESLNRIFESVTGENIKIMNITSDTEIDPELVLSERLDKIFVESYFTEIAAMEYVQPLRWSDEAKELLVLRDARVNMADPYELNRFKNTKRIAECLSAIHKEETVTS